MAAGSPVVTPADSGGPLEFVRDGDTGLVVPPTPKAIGEAFDRLFADRAAATAMGVAGRELVRTRVPGWADVVSRLLD
jgi:glycosyltransferase involved in cell wall biosynthesis